YSAISRRFTTSGRQPRRRDGRYGLDERPYCRAYQQQDGNRYRQHRQLRPVNLLYFLPISSLLDSSSIVSSIRGNNHSLPLGCNRMAETERKKTFNVKGSFPPAGQAAGGSSAVDRRSEPLKRKDDSFQQRAGHHAANRRRQRGGPAAAAAAADPGKAGASDADLHVANDDRDLEAQRVDQFIADALKRADVDLGPELVEGIGAGVGGAPGKGSRSPTHITEKEECRMKSSSLSISSRGLLSIISSVSGQRFFGSSPAFSTLFNRSYPLPATASSASLPIGTQFLLLRSALRLPRGLSQDCVRAHS
ncbi:hypothetical protein A4X13_0g4532, partial [Tilletia indica]